MHLRVPKLNLPGFGRILRCFWPEIRKQKLLLAGSFSALIAETALRLLEPWPLKYIFDTVILPQSGAVLPAPLAGAEPTVVLTALALGLVAIAALRAGAAYLAVVGMSLVATQVMSEVRARLYSQIQRLSLAFHSRHKSGDLIARVTSDTERLREVTVTAALPLLTNFLTLFGMLAVMFWLNFELALLAAAILPVFLVSTVRLTGRIHKVARTQRRREGAMAASAAESIGAIKVVQALSLQGLLERSFKRDNLKSLKEGERAQQLAAGLERTVELLVGAAIALVLWRGAQLVLERALTPGDLLVFVTYLKTAFKPMRYLAKYTGQIAKATASGERVVEVIDSVPDVRDLPGAVEAPPLTGAIRFEGVSFGYQPGSPILEDLDFTIAPGERIALVGPSGGGKSTLASLILRLYDPSAGRVLIDGHDARSYKLDSLRRQVSIVLQESVLFAVSVRDNIAYGAPGTTGVEVEAAARLANAHSFIEALPQGYDTILGERGASLSGGQRQRIAIARAAVRRSPIVVLDEPTVGLDGASEQAVNEALERLTQGRTTILISHDLQAACSAERIFFIEAGRLVEQGSHTELLRAGGRYAALYRCQVPAAASGKP
ncbi:ABC transporter ATP-binding protein [Gloeobacter violaceus]|uniref:HlyB/MsbA family ABC transporter n=1 Tax=Gloeobacter violaceus (strain ATCC 29082 / PCC 7421) TaxID=251221 RepID=Q7NLQ4_GLOVI|nr:ABC transporter ATP-binding protein [Gloeobacter violaceus]BAC89008.1 HlyB/MsbA family ABC transporter [Gloeobacter violaceus PCC 7421]